MRVAPYQEILEQKFKRQKELLAIGAQWALFSLWQHLFWMQGLLQWGAVHQFISRDTVHVPLSVLLLCADERGTAVE